MIINKYIVAIALLLGLFACDDSEVSIQLCSDITNLSSVSREGEIELKWDYPEGDNTISYIEVCYFDPTKQKDIRKTVSVHANNCVIKNTLQKYGEYHFQVQPFSQSCTPGNVYEVSATSLRAPIVYEFSSTEFVLSAKDLYVEGIRDSEPGNLLDGNNETFVNTDYSKPIGTVFWIDFSLPKEQEFLKFSYINRNNSAASFPSKIECWVKAQAEDDWTLIKTLTSEDDLLPSAPLGQFTSVEFEAPFKFKHFRFKVPETHTGKPNFSLAEFRVFDVSYTFIDPEADDNSNL